MSSRPDFHFSLRSSSGQLKFQFDPGEPDGVCPPAESNHSRTEFSLAFADLPAHDLKRLVPHQSRHYLRYSLMSFFRRDRFLDRACRRLYRGGVRHVGNIICLTPQQASVWLGGDERGLRAMRARLAAVGLDFNMQMPGWDDGMKALLAFRLNQSLGERLRAQCHRALVQAAQSRRAARLVSLSAYRMGRQAALL